MTDVVLFVLDCVGADAFSGEVESPRGPSIDFLRGRSYTFPRAISPSNWTLPSIGSILTARPPWEHGAISDGSRIRSDIPTVAEVATDCGFHTISISGNPYVSDSTGLTRGFNFAAWGRFGDCFFRGIPVISRPSVGGERRHTFTGANVPSAPITEQTIRGLQDRLVRSFPGVPDVLSRLAARIWLPKHDTTPRTGPWIEGTLRWRLRMLEREKPLFLFVNLLDAHEPYMGLRPRSIGRWSLREIWNAHAEGARTPRNGFELPSQKSLEILKELYARSVEVAVRRLEALLRLVARFRNIDDSLIIVTGDHGQMFGEEGSMYHGTGTSDLVFRVPLLVAPPKGVPLALARDEWYSTFRIGEMITGVVRGGRSMLAQRYPETASPVPEDDVVWSLATDHQVPRALVNGTGVQAPTTETFRLVGFSRSRKYVVSPTDLREDAVIETNRTTTSRGPNEFSDGRLPSVLAGARAISRQLHDVRDVDSGPNAQRVLLWGYE